VHQEPDDTELEEELRQVAARIEPVPPRLLAAAVDAFTWRTIDADLAELVFDSLTDQDETALVRGSQHDRLLSFRASGLDIEVEVATAGPARSLIGQLVPAQRATVDIRHRDGMLTLQADELGRFSAELLPVGPVSLRCALAAGSGPAVVTDWVPI
jgi:hypothetical protein